jgi:hypothetical protein
MKELFKGKLEIVQLFKKYFAEIRKKEVENSTELLKELDRKSKMLNSRLKVTKNEKENIYRKLEKIQDIKDGKVETVNVNRYVIRFLLIILLCISFLNISLNLKGYNYFIYVSAVIIILLSLLSLLITVIIKKKIFSAYYYNYDIKKIFIIVMITLGTGYFLNSYRQELEDLNKKSVLIKEAEINSIDELKNSSIEIVNKDSRIKWRIDGNLKIITNEDSKKGNINIENTVIDDNNKVTLYFTNEKNESQWLKGKIIYFNWDTVKIKLKNKKRIEGEVYGKIIKLDNGETLILNNNFELRDENKKISDFGVIGINLKIKEIINNLLFIALIIFIIIEYEYYKFPNEDRQKIIDRLMLNERKKKAIKKSVFSMLQTVRFLMFPVALIQTYLLRSYILNLLFDKNLKKGYDTISVLLSYFSKSYLLIFIILLLPVFMENFKILKMIEKYIRKNGDDELSHMKNKRSYLRTIGYNRRKNNSYRMFLGKIRNRK